MRRLYENQGKLWPSVCNRLRDFLSQQNRHPVPGEGVTHRNHWAFPMVLVVDTFTWNRWGGNIMRQFTFIAIEMYFAEVVDSQRLKEIRVEQFQLDEASHLW